ncbi:MAG: hypothetical protein WDO24_06715 [Pseudomonadota bacterium]
MTNAANAFTGTLTIVGPATSASITDSSALTLGASSAGAMTITADTINSVTGVALTGALTIQQQSAAQNIRLGGASPVRRIARRQRTPCSPASPATPA